MRMKRGIRIASTWPDRIKGLLGANPSAEILLLTPCRSIHTFGMGFPIDVAFIDREGVVLRAKRSVPSCRMLKQADAYAVLERCSLPRARWFQRGDRIGIDAFLSSAGSITRAPCQKRIDKVQARRADPVTREFRGMNHHQSTQHRSSKREGESQ